MSADPLHVRAALAEPDNINSLHPTAPMLAQLAATAEALLQQIRQLRAHDPPLAATAAAESEALLRLIAGEAAETDETVLAIPVSGARIVCVRPSARVDPMSIVDCHRSARGTIACLVDPSTVAILVSNSPRPAGDDRGLVAARRVSVYARTLDPLSAVGISGAVKSADQMKPAYSDARDAATLAEPHQPIIEADAYWAEITLHRLSQHLDKSIAAAAPFTRLAAYDNTHGTSLVATIRAALHHGSDLQLTAKALCIHPNTLRYRLRRVTQLTGLNIHRPDHRSVAHLMLLGPGSRATPSNRHDQLHR